ncbi:acyloxyacyl hydrolase [Parablastomonas sp. CN1-191]|uniref:acyloxyacyl hydrolase n=1 Tax=Parablastomonas sp. CN1-191 TaxID=3400908 RepID=UPI003BF785F5
MLRHALIAACAAAAVAAVPAQAREAYVGVHKHEVNTPFTLDIPEGGADIQFGVRWDRQAGLAFIGKPAPYVIGSINTQGDTSFAGAGLSWPLPIGKSLYVRPGLGMVVHTGPDLRFDPVTFRRTDLGSRVLFEPELAAGIHVSPRISVEASWTHISHARIFNRDQNPGIDMIGARVNLGF